MGRGTTYGNKHSYTQMGLLEQSVEIAPAEPKLAYTDIPGANGSKDLTEALGVGVKYNDREIVWTYALYPEQDWYETQSTVSHYLNGKACHIILDDDPDWYWDGRVSITAHQKDKLLRQITVKARVRPYKLKTTPSSVDRNDLTDSYKSLTLEIGVMPLIPTVVVQQVTTLKLGDKVITVEAGTHRLPDLLMAGTVTLKAKLAAGQTGGLISVQWREGSL